MSDAIGPEEGSRGMMSMTIPTEKKHQERVAGATGRIVKLFKADQLQPVMKKGPG